MLIIYVPGTWGEPVGRWTFRGEGSFLFVLEGEKWGTNRAATGGGTLMAREGRLKSLHLHYRFFSLSHGRGAWVTACLSLLSPWGLRVQAHKMAGWPHSQPQRVPPLRDDPREPCQSSGIHFQPLVQILPAGAPCPIIEIILMDPRLDVESPAMCAQPIALCC